MTSRINRRQLVSQEELFAGNPLHYKRFIRHFVAYTTRGVVDTYVRLNLLISSCTGEGRKDIADCILENSPEEEYFKALRILPMYYGQEHALVDAYVLLVKF